jgi:DNA repair protein RecN (Recombination protein N)
MLQQLHIRNYAIIDEIIIKFSNQLNIITGETGAGKSILMGALSLILGERADTHALMNRENKCVIEGLFLVNDKQNIRSFLEANDLEYDDELVIRREIAPNGKSRAFINDTPATLQQLKELASMLVDLHQQFDTLEIGNTDFQREVVDAIANNEQILASYKTFFQQYSSASKELKSLQEQKNNFNKELDYFQFLYDELKELSLKENELEELEKELKVLSHTEDIKNTLSKVYFDLKESEAPVTQTIKQLINQLNSLSAYHKDVAALAERMQSVHIELQDISGEVDFINSTVLYDEERINIINERLNAGYKMLKKHNVQQTNQLLQIQHDLSIKLEAVLNLDDTILQKQKEVEKLLHSCNELAENLSSARKKITPSLEEQINKLLQQVGMPNARIKISIQQTTLHNTGKDEIEFLFDANKSNRFEPVRKVASGGELSRLMLCIKSLVAESIDLPTMIFDEIDTGISGEAAKQVGVIMKQLASSRQVICITHQPQIAGKANAHFFVYKEIKGNAVITNIRLLSQDERITAIAQMLSGEKPTAAALENAREMVMN